MARVRRVYLGGPMRGIPLLNFPAFFEAADIIRDAGYIVFCPADQDTSVFGLDPALGDDALAEAGLTVRDVLASDLAWICHYADALVLLPGWETSPGSLAEKATAKAVRIPVFDLNRFLEVWCSDAR